MHSFYKIILFHSISQQICFAVCSILSTQQTCFAVCFPSVLKGLATFNLHRTFVFRSLSSLILASLHYRYIIFQCRCCACPPICIVDSVTMAANSPTPQLTSHIFFVSRRIARRFILFHLAIDKYNLDPFPVLE